MLKGHSKAIAITMQQCKWLNLVNNFGTYANCSTCWPNFERMQVASLGDPFFNWCKWCPLVVSILLLISCIMLVANVQPPASSTFEYLTIVNKCVFTAGQSTAKLPSACPLLKYDGRFSNSNIFNDSHFTKLGCTWWCHHASITNLIVVFCGCSI